MDKNIKMGDLPEWLMDVTAAVIVAVDSKKSKRALFTICLSADTYDKLMTFGPDYRSLGFDLDLSNAENDRVTSFGIHLFREVKQKESVRVVER